MRIGITGTREGMDSAQKEQFLKEVRKLLKGAPLKLFEPAHHFHHGDCVGADAEGHDLIRDHFPDLKITVHPPVDPAHQAFKKGDFEREPKTHFARNRDIVNACDVLLVAPLTNQEQEKGGTWYTKRYAEKVGKPFILLERKE